MQNKKWGDRIRIRYQKAKSEAEVGTWKRSEPKESAPIETRRIVGTAQKITQETWYDCICKIYEAGDSIEWGNYAPIHKPNWVKFNGADGFGCEDRAEPERQGPELEITFGKYLANIAGRILILTEEELTQ